MRIPLFFLFSLFSALISKAQINIAQDDSMIRASRIRTNELIANHDLKGLSRYWLKDYVRIAGNGNISMGKDSSVAFWAKSFKDHPEIYYVRTTTALMISEDGLSAWEIGTWAGFNTKSKSGNYAAIWYKQDNIWKLQSEQYITLSYY